MASANDQTSADSVEQSADEIAKVMASYSAVYDLSSFQRTCLHGNSEEVKDAMALQLIDLNSSDKGPLFLPLVLAAYSGSADTVFEILDGGINGIVALQTALTMAERRSHFHIINVIRNFVSRNSLKNIAQRYDMTTAFELSNLHHFVCETNISPVRLAINLLKYQLGSHMENLFKILNDLQKEEMERQSPNGSRALKYFFMALVINEVGRFEKYALQYFGTITSTSSSLEVAVFYFIQCFHSRRGPDGLMVKLFRHCLRDFIYQNSAIYRTLLRMVTSHPNSNELVLLRYTIFGIRNTSLGQLECACCGDLFPPIKCQYCDDVYYCGDLCLMYYGKFHETSCHPSQATANDQSSSLPALGDEIPKDTPAAAAGGSAKAKLSKREQLKETVREQIKSAKE